MPQLSLYLSNRNLATLRARAAEEGVSMSEHVNHLIEQDKQSREWPEGFWDLFGAIQDDSFIEPIDFLPEELDAESVQRAHEVVVVPALHHVGDAAAHLRRSLVGKGQAKDIGRVDAQHVHDVGVAVGECLGLSRSGPRHHADAALGGLDGLRLPAVESFKDIFHVTKIPLSLSIIGIGAKICKKRAVIVFDVCLLQTLAVIDLL